VARKRPNISAKAATVERTPPLHPYDVAVSTLNPDAVAAEHRTELLAVLSGFARYEAGDDAGARETLQAIGASSPFADWKLLLRGLIAFQANDDARAIENWQRLKPERLPFRLAAPVRSQCDPEFEAIQPASVKLQAAQYFGTPMLRSVLELIPLIGRDRALDKAMTVAEKLMPLVKAERPSLVPRLAGILYQAVARYGKPADLVHYRKIFGAPAHDPDFHRINALGYEVNSPEEGLKHWLSYDKWLQTSPPGWEPNLLRVARALVLRQVGRLCHISRMKSEAPDDMLSMIEALMSRGRGKMLLTKKPTLPPATNFWRDAFALNPADAELTIDLMEDLQEMGDFDEAAAVARRHLAIHPDSQAVLGAFGELCVEMGDRIPAYEAYRTALQANPLDAKLRRMTTGLAHSAYRSLSAKHDATKSAAMLKDAVESGDPIFAALSHSLLGVLARKAKKVDEIAKQEAALNALPNGRVAGAIVAAADATIFKFKPAEKKPYADRLKEVFAGPATVVELWYAQLVMQQFDKIGIDYTGRGTTGKKVSAMLLDAVKTDATVNERTLVEIGKAMIAIRRFADLDKLAAGMNSRFPMNPWFTLFLAECLLGKAADSGKPPQWRKLDTWTSKTRRLSRNHPDLIWIEQRLQKIEDPAGPVDIDEYLPN